MTECNGPCNKTEDLQDAVAFKRRGKITKKKKKTKLQGLGPRANYTDRATAACRRSDC
jgi:hypothetical protein